MAAFSRALPRLSKARGWSRRKQAGFIHLGIRSLLFSNPRRFTVYDLFRANEPGFHFETYDPNSLLQRRNRLTYSSQFSNAAWTRGAILSVTENADGVGDLVVPNATSTQHSLSQAVASVGVSNAVTVRAKAGGYNFLQIGFVGAGSVWFNLSAGTVGSVGAGASGSIVAAGGGYYDCTAVAASPTGATASIYVTNADGFTTFAGDGVSGIYVARAQLEWNTTTPGEYQEVTDWNTEYIAAAGTANIGMWQDAAGTTAVTGVEQPVGRWMDWRLGKGVSTIAATQSSSSSRPILSARYNLLTKTEQLSDAAWTKTAAGTGIAPTVTDNYGAVAAPNGTFTASRVQLDKGAGATGSDFSALQQTASVGTAGRKHSVWMRTNDGSTKALALRDVNYNIKNVTGAWQEFTIEESGATASGGFQIILRGTFGTADSVDLLVWHPDVRSSNDAALNQPAYQRVNTANDYETTGFRHYLRFDGTDDSLATPSVDFSACTDMTAWAAATKLSDAAAGVLAEGASSGPGTTAVFAPGAATPTYAGRSSGTLTATATTASSYASPSNAVLTLLAQIATDSVTLRVNGTSAATSSADQGTGNYSNHIVYIGRRGGSTVPFNGRVYSYTQRGSTTPTSEAFIAKMNRYAAQLMAVTI